MTEYMLLIVGTEAQAKLACVSQGLVPSIIEGTGSKDVRCIVDVKHVERLQKWLNEDLQHFAPYPVGSLLYFRKI